METGHLKNMVVLKNVPSNIIEEAMVVLKKNVKLKETEMQNYIENEANKNTKKNVTKENGKSKDYIIKEAEMIIHHYMTNIENNKKKEILNKKMNQKYHKMKKYLWMTSLMCLIEMLLILMK